MNHIQHIDTVTAQDAVSLRESERQYGGSWKQRGGIGAFMMLARKWDRIERRVEQSITEVERYDLFAHLSNDRRGEGLIDDIRDLRRYLVLVEAEMMARGVIHPELQKGSTNGSDSIPRVPAQD